MAGGGKGGSSSTSVEIPQFLEDAAQRAIARGDQNAQTGYVPYMGVDVAGMSPGMEAARQGVDMKAAAYGLPTTGGSYMPRAVEQGGLTGYRSARPYFDAVTTLAQRRPGQYQHITGMFLDPQTGEGPANPMFAQPLVGNPIFQPSMPTSDQTLGGQGREDRAQEAARRAERDAREAAREREFSPGGIFEGVGNTFDGLRDTFGNVRDSFRGRAR